MEIFESGASCQCFRLFEGIFIRTVEKWITKKLIQSTHCFLFTFDLEILLRRTSVNLITPQFFSVFWADGINTKIVYALQFVIFKVAI